MAWPFRTVTQACPALAVIVAVFVAGCGASVAVCAVRLTAGVVATGVADILLAGATSPTRTSTRTTRVLISRRVATVVHTMEDIREDTEVVMVQAPTNRSPVSK
jgi:hypothetical protein